MWDWRAESYVLKQQGHSAFIAAAAFSPNGSQLATAADDSKVRCSTLACLPASAPAYLPPGRPATHHCTNKRWRLAGEGVVAVDWYLQRELLGACVGGDGAIVAAQRRGPAQRQPGRHSARLRPGALPQLPHLHLAAAGAILQHGGGPQWRGVPPLHQAAPPPAQRQPPAMAAGRPATSVAGMARSTCLVRCRLCARDLWTASRYSCGQ